MLEDINSNGKTTKSKSISDSNINLHPLIIKLQNAEEKVLKKDDGFWRSI